MTDNRDIHPDFRFYLDFKTTELAALYRGLRTFVLSICPGANELLYHTHALTSLYSVTEKMSDGFCMIPIYTGHLNLGFNRGTLLPDKQGLLHGTGKLIRHIPIAEERDYNNVAVGELIEAALQLALADAEGAAIMHGATISKIKR